MGKVGGERRIAGELDLRKFTFDPILTCWFPRSIHVVSLVHSVVIIYLSWSALRIPGLEKDRAFGWDDRAGLVFAVAIG